MALPKFSFEKKSQRYRFKTGDRAGQFVSKAKVRSLVEERIQQERDALDRLAANLVNESIRLQDFEKGVAKRLKNLHIQSYILGKGGEGVYDNRVDKAAIAQKLETEYRYLRRFTEQIKRGELTEAQIRARTKSYGSAAYGTQQQGTAAGHKDNDYNYEKNILSAVENCWECEYLSYLGVVRIGQISRVQPPGTRICFANCRCHIEFYRDRP